uniref:Cytochrome c biogenesis protein CcsA n=1 Tax=Gloeochaete wittrockiana TaxID=38269 RepID=A0A3G1IVS8_9EUKA|nr:cytochrome c biogenesis protein [Gloeochaete wittrockiana]ASQ40150.1 cytochrome c biogenesis protein [Gloeochaete wittrockiana]|eukprot:TRINITY_DN34643_c0_g1_i1.p1 TRINITY_DN34643_c0_g1~~TRINITY_DN34643_c0_g1_i1.p1  ORF type:complete len:296 (-),score=-127.84 TRINITY_DN34643_c0_g1_i1:300-1187(-)
MINTISWLEGFSWITTSVLTLSCLVDIYSKKSYFWFKNFQRIGLFILNLSIIIIMSNRWLVTHYLPLTNLYESLLFLSWLFIILQFLFKYELSNKFVNLLFNSLITICLSFCILFLPSSMQEITNLAPSLKSNWLIMHVTVILISYALLLIGSLLSIAYIIIDFTKNKTNHTIVNKNLINFGKNINLNINSSNEILDQFSYRFINLGFSFLTLGIIAGAVWANDAWGSYWSWDPKETWALITWLIYATYLHLRIVKNWHGIKSAFIASLGFIMVWFCYLGVNFLGQGLHSYGWFF